MVLTILYKLQSMHPDPISTHCWSAVQASTIGGRCDIQLFTDSWWQTVPEIYHTLSIKILLHTTGTSNTLNNLYACPRVVVVGLYSKNFKI